MEQKEAALRNQGLNPGDEAYDYAMADIGRERTDAYDTAMRSSIGIGGAEGQRDQAMDLTAGNFGNQVRQARIAEEMQARGFSLNEINAILSGQQIGMPSMPGFNTAERAQGADYNAAANSQWGADMDAFSAQQAQAQMLMEGVTGAAGMFMGSDRRLKSNITKIGTANGHNVYRYNIWGHEAVGVMADEMPPELVARHADGYLMVDYGRVLNG
jgi:hypothetical protein